MSGALRARFFEEQDATAWDGLVAESWNGTFLHSRRFLAYHGDRFRDRSIVVEDDRGRMLGVMPAAVDPADPSRVVSHPGITFGGIVHGGRLAGGTMIEAMQAACSLLRDDGFRQLRYKAVPHIYHTTPAQDDLYALFRVGARRYRSDLSATLERVNRPPMTTLRRRSLRKAERSGVAVESGSSFLTQFWPVLEATLREGHGARPVHSVDEIVGLQRTFPDQIECVVGTLDGTVVAGTVLFHTEYVAHTQYLAASETGKENSALDFVLNAVIERTAAPRQRYVDFGTSNEADGTYLNEGLVRYKQSFGAGGVIHEFYEVSLIVEVHHDGV